MPSTEKSALPHGPQVPEPWLQDKRINSMLTGKKFTLKIDKKATLLFVFNFYFWIFFN